MATVVDALIVTLGLDSSKFKSGSREATEEMKRQKKQMEQLAKDMEAAGKRAASFFSSIRNEILALAGVALTAQGVSNFITKTSDSLSKLGYASQTLGFSAKSLDGWIKSFSRFGASADQVKSSMLSLQNDLALFRNKGQLSEGLVMLTGRLGVNLQNARGQFKSVQDIYLELADRFKNMDAASRTMYGRDVGLSPEMVNMLSQGRETVSKQVTHYTNMSGATDNATKAAQRYEQQLADLSARFDVTKQRLLVGIMPVLNTVNRLLGELADWLAAHQAEIATFFNNLFKDIEKAVAAVGGWSDAIKILIGFTLASWASGIIATIGRVSLAIAGMINSLLLKSGGGIVGKAGVAGAAAYFSEEYIDKALNSAFGNNQWFQNVRTARDFSELWDSINGDYHLSRDAGGNWQRNGGSELSGDVRGNWSDNPKAARKRGIRNNNPGNLNFANQAGASKESGPDGRFAVFGTMAEGIAALYRQLQLYFERGINTISSIVKKYAPESDGNNVGAYIAALSKATGLGANDTINPDNISAVIKLMKGIANHENGSGYFTDADMLQGIRVGSSLNAGRGSPSAGRSETHIGEIKIYTQASDAEGMARDVRRELGKNPLISIANGGQS